MPSQAAAAAVTDEVSLTAVPVKRPNPSFDKPRKYPKEGKINAAITLKRKITEIEVAMSSLLASIMGAVAAIAEPPQIEEPTPMSIETFGFRFISL